MGETEQRTCAAFVGDTLVAEGDILDVAIRLKALPNASNSASYLVFDGSTGNQIDLDLSGTDQETTARLGQRFGRVLESAVSSDVSGASTPKTVGRPKLGVVAREVTLLPRHWEWLNKQPGGASVALRKLVEEAKKTHSQRDAVRHSQEAAYRFMSAKAGNYEGFEEATRALFRTDKSLFLRLTDCWPAGVRDFSRKLADVALRGSD